MAAGSQCFQVLRLQKNTVGDFHLLLQLSGWAIFFFSSSRTPAELSLGIFNTVHNRCWSSENTPGITGVCWWGEGSCFVLALRRCCRPSVAPAIRHFPLAQIVLLGWVIVSFQCVTPTCDEHNVCLNGAFSPFVLALYLCATLIAETFWDAFWIAYEPCGRVCAGGLLFSHFLAWIITF